MPATPFECGPGRLLRLQLGMLYGVAAAAVALSALPWPGRAALMVLILAACARLLLRPRQWLHHDAAGWWLADAGSSDWQGPWQLGPGGYLGGAVAILELRRDRRRQRCIICRDSLGADAWRRLSVQLAHR